MDKGSNFKVTRPQMQALCECAQKLGDFMSEWATSLKTDEKANLVNAALNHDAQLAVEFAPVSSCFRLTLLAKDGITRVVLTQIPLPIKHEALQ